MEPYAVTAGARDDSPPRLTFGPSPAVPRLQLNGSMVRAHGIWLRATGYLLLISAATVVIALAALPRTTPLRLYDVTSGSMVPALPVGSVAVVDTARRTPKVGAIVAFDPPSDPDQVFTHRVIAILPDGSFKTEGVAVHTPDAWTVPARNVVGTVTAKLPYAAVGLAVLRVAVLLTLGAFILSFAFRRVGSRRLPPELLVGGVLSGSLFYLFAVLKPLFGAGVSFLGLDRNSERIDVINTGWVPIRAYSLANPHDHTPVVAPDSTLRATLHFAPHSGLERTITVRIVPAPTLVDLVVMALVVFSPLLLSLLMAARQSRRARRFEVGRTGGRERAAVTPSNGMLGPGSFA